MEGFLGEEQDFVGDTGLDQELLETDEGGGGMLPGLGAGQDPGS